jgi:hypothetical protein
MHLRIIFVDGSETVLPMPPGCTLRVHDANEVTVAAVAIDDVVTVQQVEREVRVDEHGTWVRFDPDAAAAGDASA